MEKVIVIGGGISGLSAGIYAKLAGFDVEIYEKNPLPGGECMGWNRNGYHIDNCIHWLTGTKKGTELYDVWKTVGALSDATEYAQTACFYSSVYHGQTAALWRDLDRTRRELIALSPEDEAEITKFIQYVEYSKQCLIPAKKPMEMWSLKDYLNMGMSMPDFLKVLKELGKISLDEYSKRFHHPLIQKLLCDYLPKSYCAHSLLVSYATMAVGNGNIPLGGSLRMSLRMEKKYLELGGKIYYNKSVKKINISRHRATGITLSDGRIADADYIIPTVDTHVLFDSLLAARYMPKALKAAYDNPKAYPATSGFQVAYSVPASFPVSETFFYDIAPLCIGKNTFERMNLKVYDYDTIYRKDGRCVIQTCITQTDDDYAYWKSLTPEEYRTVKQRLVGEITARIEKLFPDFKGEAELLDAWTPLTYERYCNAYHGSYMSFIMTPMGKQLNLKGTLSGIKNVFLAGQWTSSPGGLPIAVVSGKFAVQRLLKKQHRSIEIGEML